MPVGEVMTLTLQYLVLAEGRLDPIVDPRIFRQAQRILATRYLSLPNEEMLKRLRILLKERGHPSKGIIDEAAGLPCATLYQLRFGSLRSAYRLIGFTSSRDCEYIDSRERWAELNAKLVAQAADEIKKAGGRYTFPNGATDCLLVNKTVSVCFRVARWCAGKKEIHSPHWSIGQRNRFPAGWIVAIRLAEKNTGVLDYVLLLTTNIAGPLFRFSEKSRTSRGIERFEQFDALLRSLIRRVTTTRHASPTKTQRLKRAPISSRSKRKSGRGGR
jgi:hypothetical protein